MVPTVRFVILVAIRDRLFISIFSLLAALLAISAYVGGTALFEAPETAIAIAAGSTRIALVLGLAIFVALSIERLYETREIELILSRALSRPSLVAALALGFFAVALVVAIPICLLLTLLAPSVIGSLVWSLSLFGEAMVVLMFAIFAGMAMERAVPTLFATFAFYCLCRLMSLFLGIAVSGTQAGANAVANPVIEGIGFLVPRLDLFAQSQWLVYGVRFDGALGLIAAQAGIYVVLLLFATSFDLLAKDF